VFSPALGSAETSNRRTQLRPAQRRAKNPNPKVYLSLDRLGDLQRLLNSELLNSELLNSELNIDSLRDVLNPLKVNTQFRLTLGPDQTPSIEIRPAQGLAQNPRQRILNFDMLRKLTKRVNGEYSILSPEKKMGPA